MEKDSAAVKELVFRRRKPGADAADLALLHPEQGVHGALDTFIPPITAHDRWNNYVHEIQALDGKENSFIVLSS